MEDLTPNTRYEKFLSAAAGSGTAPDPVTREEKFLKAIADNAGGGGSSGGVLVVHMDENTGALDKTWQEIHDAVAAGQIVNIPLYNGETEAYTTLVGIAWLTSDDKYGLWVYGSSAQDPALAIADTANDYPVVNNG